MYSKCQWVELLQELVLRSDVKDMKPGIYTAFKNIWALKLAYK